MATIYAHNGETLTEGLQGATKSDEALDVAVRIAAERAEPVILDDDDGEWLVHPDGTVETHWSDEEKEDAP